MAARVVDVLFDEVGGRRRGRALAVALVALACALMLPAAAWASEFTVNSVGDGVDAAHGGEICATSGGECTLRAAIEEADYIAKQPEHEGEPARIEFDETIFNGQPAATIDLTSGLPAMTVKTTVEGRFCETAPKATNPCVGIDAPSGATALTVKGAASVVLRGLAVTGAQTAVSLENAPNFKLFTDWFGVGLDGAPDANGTGVLVGPGSDNGQVGSEGPEKRNVFAANSGDGLDIQGAADVRVLGNYFGVMPNGATRAANGGDDIEVTSTEGSEASGVSIGTRVGAAVTVSPQCDGGCNVIAGADGDGVDLEGDGLPELPAVSTAVAGNYIGLDANGLAAVPNGGAGVHVGEASGTRVGGPAGGEANRIDGGDAAVLAGPAAPNLAVRGNSIGADAEGDLLMPPDAGIVVDSAELPSPAAEAQIAGNEIHMEGGVGIVQRGQGAWILDNRIFGAQTGIQTSESAVELGNVIEGNLVEGPAGNGILLETGFNEVIGNQVMGAGESGVLIHGSPPNGVFGNLIGGSSAVDENVISGSAGDAVEVSDLETTDNEVARNRGTDNQGLFIDLVAASPGEPKGPNHGISPPRFTTANQSGAHGVGAEPGATIRVFNKQTAFAGELEEFLGQAVADKEGIWSVAYGDAIPGGTIVAATQTSEAGGTSELSTATTSGSSGGSSAGEGENSQATPAFGVTGGQRSGRPHLQTKILTGPRKMSVNGAAQFRFKSNEPGVLFLCKLDDRPFNLCRSPKRYRNLKPGKHVFQVRAVDRAGHADRTPAKRKFTVPG